MTKLASTLSVFLAFAVVGIGCGGGDDNGGGGDGGSKSTTPSSGVSSTKPQSVVMKNIQFNPKTITVPPGATVTWTNKDTVAHDVTGSDFKSGSSGGMTPGDTYSHTFNRTSSFKYRCTVHPGMQGTVVVK
jgi:plastocyanin